MGAPSRVDPVSILRRILVVAVLSVGIALLHQYAVPGDGLDPRAMLALGFVILAAYAIGELATVVGIPHITGYLLSGILFGPSIPEIVHRLAPHLVLPPPLDGGILSRGVIGQLGPLDGLALALIALSAGGELELDELRRSFGYVVGSTVGMVATTVAAVFGFLVLAVWLGPSLLPGFAGLSTQAALALCLVMATLAAATSPAVSIAVVHSTGARGPVASTVLTGVVVGEILVVVLFSGTSSVALPLLGGTGEVSVPVSVARVAASGAFGLLVGGAIAAYLRFVAADLLLFLLGAIYASTFVVQSFGGEPAVAFIAAGLVVGNAHRVSATEGADLGRTLLTGVERISKPVFTVFFALAGAKLHLDVLAALAVPAGGIFAVRWVAVRYGTAAGARLAGAPAVVEQYAWMGFVSQAGLAIALASQARSVLPEGVANSVYSLALATIAFAELIGPSVLQRGLKQAGEIPEGGPSARPAPTTTVEPGPGPVWAAPEPSPWPVVPDLADPRLVRALSDLEEALLETVDAEVTGPLEGLRRDAETWVRLLRQQINRLLRPARWAHLQDRELAGEMRRALVGLGESWAELVRAFDPAAGIERSPCVSGPIVERVDRLVASLPPSMPAPIPPGFLAPRTEPLPPRARRWMLRLAVRWVGAQRSVSLRDLGRFHLSGGMPASLEPVMALVPHARCHVADRTSEWFRALTDCVVRHAAEAEAGAPTEVVLRDLTADLLAIEARFAGLMEELAAIASDGTERARTALGRPLDALFADAERAGTFELPGRRRRYGPRFRERNRTSRRLQVAVQDARTLVRSRYDELVLELELAVLRIRSEGVAIEQATLLHERFGRQVLAGLAQIDLDLDGWIRDATAAIDRAPTHDALAAKLNEAWAEVRGNVGSAVGQLRGMADALATQAWVDPLTEGMTRALEGISPAHLLGVRRDPPDRTVLPPAPRTTGVASARRAAAHLEATVVRQLRAFGEELAGDVAEALVVAMEVERVTQFNVDLALAELELLPPDDPPTPERRDLLRSMLVAAPSRTRQRLRQRQVALAPRQATLGPTVLAITDGLGGLAAALRSAPAAAPREPFVWLRSAGGAVAGGRDGFLQMLRLGLGEDRMLGLRTTLGLPAPAGGVDLVAALRAPTTRIPVPPVYARLFSDLPFEAGELVAGRQDELEQVRTALSSGLRSAAVVGIDPHGARALVTAVVGAGRDPIWFDADGPAAPGTVARWFAPYEGSRDNVFVVENPRWLFRRAPGGFAEIDALTHRIVEDRGQNQWVLVADGGVWQYLSAATALGSAMGVAVTLDALSVDELQRALLSRHAMSGYAAVFESDADLVYRALRLLRGGTEEERSRAAWFRTLHAASGGVLQDAMRLWLASVEGVDDEAEQVVLGPVPRPPLAHIGGLDEPVLLTLLETRRQGWMDAESHARLFRTAVATAEAHLAQLRHLGLLVGHGPVSKFAPHLRGPVEQVLGQREWT